MSVYFEVAVVESGSAMGIRPDGSEVLLEDLGNLTGPKPGDRTIALRRAHWEMGYAWSIVDQGGAWDEARDLVEGRAVPVEGRSRKGWAAVAAHDLPDLGQVDPDWEEE